MKIFVSVVIFLSMLVSFVALMPITATDSLLSTDKLEYAVGENIYVTATGTGTDWVGIYKMGENPGGEMQSIYWYYVADVSGKAYNIKEATYKNDSRSDYFGLPTGNYTIYLCSNDSYTVIESIDIEITANVIDAKIDAEYTPSTDIMYRADGKLCITYNGTRPSGYSVYWANNRGAISGYAPYSILCKDKTTEYIFPDNTFIPEGADRLLVCPEGATEGTEIMLPNGMSITDFGTPVAEFAVLSDIHINASNSHTYNNRFTAAMEDIKKVAPRTEMLFINGDLTDHGLEAEYAQFTQIIKDYKTSFPVVYASIGNHDYRGGGSDAAQTKLFLDALGNPAEKVYYDKRIDGIHYIFLGSEKNSDGHADRAQLSSEQLAWLSAILKEDKDSGKPVFLFLHQGMKNSVAGTLESTVPVQYWHGVEQEAQLRDILKDYPQVVMFAGHSHWTLQTNDSFRAAGDYMVTYLNTAASAYLWDDRDQYIDGSQGYCVTVYEDKIVFAGRDFMNEQWIPEAQFVLELENKNEGEEENNNKGTEAQKPIETEKPDDAPASNVTEPEQDGGCGSSIGASCTAVVMVAMASFAALKPRKKEQI